MNDKTMPAAGPLDGLISQPRRVQLSRRKGWRMPDNTVVVSRRRGSPDWGNPFRIGIDGDAKQCVELFAAMWAKSSDETNREVLTPLRGKNLACWCPLDQPCHADVLLMLANNELSRPKGRLE